MNERAKRGTHLKRYWYTWDAEGKKMASPYFTTKAKRETYFNKYIHNGSSGVFVKEGLINRKELEER